jgi:hypothetical protein
MRKPLQQEGHRDNHDGLLAQVEIETNEPMRVIAIITRDGAEDSPYVVE